jgi:hypothetical protein
MEQKNTAKHCRWPTPEHLRALIFILLLVLFCIYERLHEPCFTPAIING